MLYLKRVIIKNILSFKHADLPFDTYTVIVGPNNSGEDKSVENPRHDIQK